MDTQFACNQCVSAGNLVVQTTTEQKTMSETGDITNVQLMEVMKAGIVNIKEHITANVDKNQTKVKKYMQEMTETVKKTSRINETPS